MPPSAVHGARQKKGTAFQGTFKVGERVTTALARLLLVVGGHL